MKVTRSDHVAGFTSTGSKRPEVIFGAREPGLPFRMVRSAGYRVWDADGREYTDYIMGLGAVALGYGHPAVNRAAVAAIEAGVVGPLAPVLEEELAAELKRLVPWMERARFFKTGAEAVAAAVRLARVHTGRERVLGCGYHGWLDWCKHVDGVPESTRALYDEMPFNEAQRCRELIRAAGDRLAAVVFEPVILREPDPEWLDVLREETARVGALLIADEIKTACRVALGGGAERFGFRPDLVVMAKAIANGFPLAVVGGRAAVMAQVERTWMTSTLATEYVALAAAKATLEIVTRERVPEHLRRVGGRLLGGLRRLRDQYPGIVAAVAGLPEMCHPEYTSEAASHAVTAGCARRGLLLKRSAYNFVSLAHDEQVVDRSLEVLEEVLSEASRFRKASP